MFGAVRAIFKEMRGFDMTMEKDFNFAVTLCGGYKADGIRTSINENKKYK